jgi:hypothetical protein
MANEVREPLKLYFHENTAEQASMLNTMVTNVLNNMGITSIQEEVVENAVSDYLTKHPVHDGEKGDKGDTGATPNISASATVSQTVGTPTVSVEKSGTDENPSFSFAFSGLKGEKGEKGDESNVIGVNYIADKDVNSVDSNINLTVYSTNTNAPNIPTNDRVYKIITTSASTGLSTSQIALDLFGNIFSRSRTSTGTWGTWKRLVTADELTALAARVTALENK